MKRKELLELPQIRVELPTIAELNIRKWQKRNIRTKHKTTTKLGKREYMKKYMRERRKEGKQ